MTINTDLYRAARDHLVSVIGDYDAAVESFAWPQVSGTFNWATDWFDSGSRNDRTALWIVERDGSEQKVTCPWCSSIRSPANWPTKVSCAWTSRRRP